VTSWLEKVMSGTRLRAISITAEQRIDHLPLTIEILTRDLGLPEDGLSDEAKAQATSYGETRAKQGYSAALLARETRLLTLAVSETIEGHLLEIDISTLIPGVLRIGERLNELLEAALDGFELQTAAR
jgi:hypothetical protein